VPRFGGNQPLGVIDVDAIEEHRPVSRLRLLLLGGLVGAGFVVGGILLSPTSAHADDGLLGGVGGVVSGVTQPVSQIVDSVVDTAVPVVEDVTSVVPEPVAEVVQPVVEPVVDQVVVPVVEAVPDAPVAEIVQPVTDVVDPVVAAVPVVGDILGSTPTASVTAPVVDLADSTVGQVTTTVVTVAPALPGASGPTGPGGIIPSIPGLDLPGRFSRPRRRCPPGVGFCGCRSRGAVRRCPAGDCGRLCRIRFLFWSPRPGTGRFRQLFNASGAGRPCARRAS
jgi:hypothetical protein